MTTETTPEPVTGTTESVVAPVVETTATPEAAEAPVTPEYQPIDWTQFPIPEENPSSTETIEAFKAMADSSKFTSEQVTALSKLGQSMMTDRANAEFAKTEAQKDAWANESKFDKEFGGDKFNENLAVSKRAYDALIPADSSLRELFDKTGIGNHPDIIRIFYRYGMMTSDDKLVQSGTTVTKELTMAERMYK